MNIIECLINRSPIDVDFEDNFEFRLNKMIQSGSNFALRGGDTSTQISLPRTKRNNRIFSTDSLEGVKKFYSDRHYPMIIKINGNQIFNGFFKLGSISRQKFNGELVSNNIYWVELLSEISLNQLGYVDGVPTWFSPFIGGATINSTNSMNNQSTDIFFPTIVYNNTPIIDYLDFSNIDVYGTFDDDGNQVVSPLDFPNDFRTKHAYFGWRDGLTFEDFPMATYYSNVIRKCFEQIGYNIAGDIFNEDWFNRLYMPYVGDGMKYNWKTLAYFYTDLLDRVESGGNVNEVLELDNATSIAYTASYIMWATMHFPNTAYYDDFTTRIDNVSNFNKLLVTDEYVGKWEGGGYVVPADGRYRIKVRSRYIKELIPVDSGTAAKIDQFGDGVTGFGWDDATFVIVRRNEVGEFTFSYTKQEAPDVIEDFRTDLVLWQAGVSTKFVDSPSDIIAYISPKRLDELGTSDINAVGSPISDWTETVTIVNYLHDKLFDTDAIKKIDDFVEFYIDVDLVKNERINFYWSSFIQGFDLGYFVDTADTQYNDDVTDYIEIEYLCGYEDLNIAENLPPTNCKDFIGNFINFFGLAFDTDVDAKTVKFYYTDRYYSDYQTALDITDRIDTETITITPANAPKSLIVGYNNDNNDRLLTKDVNSCDFTNTNEVLQYANHVETQNINVYAENTLNITNGFSATRFVDGVFSPVDTTDINFPSFSGVTFNAPPNYPVTGETLLAGIAFVPTKDDILIQFPSIQSKESFDAKIVGDLEYNYNYAPRILYHLGTASQYFGIPSSWKIRINSPDVAKAYDATNHWIEPTISAFHDENTNPYPTLRFDIVGGMYDTYFDDIVRLHNESHIISFDVFLNTNQWNKLSSNKLLIINGLLHRLLSVSDFDVTGVSPCKIEAIKII